MPRYRKKPVVIEAVPIADVIKAIRSSGPDDGGGLPAWVWSAILRNGTITAVHPVEHITIETLSGPVRGESCDMLIRGVEGELYPCRGDIFAATHEAVEIEP